MQRTKSIRKGTKFLKHTYLVEKCHVSKALLIFTKTRCVLVFVNGKQITNIQVPGFTLMVIRCGVFWFMLKDSVSLLDPRAV